MFDKWLNQDISTLLARRNRVVVGTEASLLDLLRKVLPQELTIVVVHAALEELECKYTVEKFHKDEKVVIIATAPKNELTFIRDYAETCGYVDIRKVESYVAERVFQGLGLNISLTPEEVRVAAYNCIGKGKEYWEELCRKGGERLFDIGSDILPFLHDPEGFCATRDALVVAAFFEKINTWLGRGNISQPPGTLAKEVAEQILGSLLTGKPKKKYLDVYKKWGDSKAMEGSFLGYCRENPAQLKKADLWAIYSAHPFDSVDLQWLSDLIAHLSDSDYINDKLPHINTRFKNSHGRQWHKGLWGHLLQLLEFDSSKVKGIASLEEAIACYTTELYRVDTAIRSIYEKFWGDEKVIRPFQEYYNQLVSPFLHKWFQYFDDYGENQKGLLIEKVRSAKGRIAIIVGDGISYEIAQRVIAKTGDTVKIDNQYRCCGIPSITENNMSLLYRDDGVLEPVQLRREAYLAAQVSKRIEFVQLEEVNFQHAEVDVLICSCKDIDDIAEKMQHKALKFIGEIENMIADKVVFLLNNGFQEVVLTSDHGFVLTGILDESDKAEVQFQGEVSKAERYIRTVEKQGVSEELIEHRQRYGEYRYLYFAKHNKPFKTPGRYGYAHGGLAPQELIIPFVTFSHKTSSLQELLVSVANQSQLSGVVGDYFSVHLKADDGAGDIFTQERKVQLLFIDNGKEFSKSDIVTIKAGELIKKEFSFDRHLNIEVIVVDALSRQTLTKVAVSQTVARDLGGL